MATWTARSCLECILNVPTVHEVYIVVLSKRLLSTVGVLHCIQRVDGPAEAMQDLLELLYGACRLSMH